MKILIVDDIKINLDLLEAILEGKGFLIEKAENGKEALRKLEKENIDLIVSDILMPNIDGFELCRKVKSSSKWKTIPFIFYTATYTDKKDEDFALKLGADEFMTKPKEPKEFLNILQKVIDKHKKSQSPPKKPSLTREDEVFKLYNERLINKLEKKTLDLEKETVGRQKVEIDLQKWTRKLQERVKELNCLLSISKLVDTPKISIEEILQGTVDLIPPSWQYPKITCARILYDKKEYRAKHFTETQWKLDCPILLEDKKCGSVEVFYLKKKRNEDEGPFLKEERNLIDAIAERMGKIIAIHKANKKIEDYSQNLERMVEKRTFELNKALTETANARDKIDAILKSVADGLIVTDIHNKVILMNRAAEELLGVRFSEVINQSIDYTIEEKSLREKMKYTLHKKITGYTFDFEHPSDGKNSPRFMRARTSVIHDMDSKTSGIVTIIHDITQERQIDKMKTEFLSTAAHELRTPLTSIRGFSEILLTRDNLTTEEKRKYLTYVLDQSVNLTKIVNDLLDISRIESGKGFTFHKTKNDINEIINLSVSYFKGQSDWHRIEGHVQKEKLWLNLDKEKIKQVLNNLINNAIKYSPEGGYIKVKGKKEKDEFVISVEDQGIGMSKNQVEKIFEKFYRANSTDNAPQGTGLGMTIVKYIVKTHHGKITIKSKLGLGTTVSFSLPFPSGKKQTQH